LNQNRIPTIEDFPLPEADKDGKTSEMPVTMISTVYADPDDKDDSDLPPEARVPFTEKVFDDLLKNEKLKTEIYTNCLNDWMAVRVRNRRMFPST